MATKPLIPVEAAATIVNSLAKQHLGSDVVVNDDLSNLVDAGRAYENLDETTKGIVRSGMITLVTEQLFIAKDYKGNGLDLVRSRKAYGQHEGVIQKNRPSLREAVDDADVYDPAEGSSSDPFKNIPIDIETDYHLNAIQYRYEWSKPDRWMTGMFLSPEGFMSAVAAMDTMIQNSLDLNLEDASLSLVRASMALNLNSAADLTGRGNNQAVNLLAIYNEEYGTELKSAQALQTPEFLRFAIHYIFVVLDYVKSYSVLYNEKEWPNFTSVDDAHVIFLSKFLHAINHNLLSDVYHQEYLALPLGDSVPAWKGMLTSGNASPSFESTSTINDTFEVNGATITVDESGVLGTIFDRGRIGIHNLAVTNTGQYDPVGLKENRFTHVFYKTILDQYENSVTFYVKDPDGDPAEE